MLATTTAADICQRRGQYISGSSAATLPGATFKNQHMEPTLKPQSKRVHADCASKAL